MRINYATFFKHKKTIDNFFHYSLLRIFNIAAKFILVAYLVRTLGEKTYGLLSWSESILQYFIIIINFGFNIYGAKYIVKHRDNKKLLNDIISSIYYIKGFFLIVSFLVLFILSQTNIPDVNFSILLLLLVSTLGDMLFPVWYFQGTEKLKPLTKIVALAKFLLLIGTVLFIKSKDDLELYIVLFSLSQILMGFLGFIALKKDANYNFIKPNRKTLKSVFRQARLYFLGNISMLVFNALTIFLIGVYVSLEKVTGFDISLKIVMFALLPFEILQAVFLPVITKTKNKKMLSKLVLISLFSGIIICVLLNLLPEFLLNLFGGSEITKYKEVLKVLSLLMVTVPSTFLLGQCGLVAFGQDKAYNYSLISIAIVYGIIVLFFLLSNSIDFYKLLYLRVFSDYLLFIIIVYKAFKSKIIDTHFLKRA